MIGNVRNLQLSKRVTAALSGGGCVGRCWFSSKPGGPIGFIGTNMIYHNTTCHAHVLRIAPMLSLIGLGHMGSKMVANISSDGNSMVIFDANLNTAKSLATDTVRAVVGELCSRQSTNTATLRD